MEARKQLFDGRSSSSRPDWQPVAFYPDSQVPTLLYAGGESQEYDECVRFLVDRRHVQQTHGTASSRATSAESTMPLKRSLNDSPPAGAPAKTPKTEAKPEDFSNSVKKRLQSSTRTGQACDRCKVRKIRCDALPGGCSPCLQNQTQCQTTDRITGRAAPRGYSDGLEAHNRDLANRVRELENLLVQNGVDFKSGENKPFTNTFQDPTLQSYSYPAPPTVQSNQASTWSAPGPSNGYTPASSSTALTNEQETNLFRALPAFRAGCTGDNYLGVSSGNSHLSSIKGTALSILGMEIDIADFASPDMDEPDPTNFHPQLYNKSYQAFLQSALNVNPRIDKVDLPSREDGIMYADWYFRVINPYLPVLHKGTFMAMLTRMYDDPMFRPTAAQTVMVHMVFAIMFFQYAVRNWEDSAQQTNLNNQSNMHYHHSLSMFYQLSCSHTVQDVQALTLICSHLRNFPKPGASWILTMTTMSLALELGLHRSVKRWAPEQAPSTLEIEMRKRTFYSLLAIHVTLSGKLGRPMLLRPEDYDIEMPESVDDEYINEIGVDATLNMGKCSYKIGIVAFKLLPLFMELYSTIYAVRRSPETYIETVNSLEAKLRFWQENLPSEIVKGEAGANDQEGRVFALYAQAWVCEFRLLLRHPSVSLTLDSNFNAESMKICVETSRDMLGIVKELQKLKSLDTTWYNSAVYVMAITTTMFSGWERRNEINAAELATLRADMDSWLDIMGDVGALLGSGIRLREAVRVVTDGTLGVLSKSLQGNTSGFAMQDVPAKSPKRINPSGSGNTNGMSSYNGSFSDNAGNGNGVAAASTYARDAQVTHQQTPYPDATQYSDYPDPNGVTTTSLAYSNQDSHAYNAYSNTSDLVDAPLLAAFANQATAVSANNWAQPRPSSQSINSGSQSWQAWTSTMAGNLEPQDRYSASALMQLGGRDLAVVSDTGTSTVPIAGMAGGAVSAVIRTQTAEGGNMGGATLGNAGLAWPQNIFDIGQGGNGAQ